jgi:hypothetical protein
MLRFNVKTYTSVDTIAAKRLAFKKAVLSVVLVFFTLAGWAQTDILKKQVTVSFKNITLPKAIDKLEKTAGISFAYSNKLYSYKNKINKKYKNKTVKFILDDLLTDKKLGYKLIGDKITIYSPKEKKKRATVSGYIIDAETGDALIGCTVFSRENLTGTSSNSFGYYNLQLDNDGVEEVVFSFVGFEKKRIIVDNRDTLINVGLQPISNELDAVKITATQDENLEKMRSTAMSSVKINSKEIKSIPAVAGETDLLKSITVLPGIKPGVDGSSGFYVRGGSIDQNLLLLDGVPIYNPYHMWGYLSSFNADAINSVTVTKGAFPARYGGRLSSVVDITMKEGNTQKWTGDFTIGLLSAKASVSGPIIKDKSSVMFTARRTYADLIIVPILNHSNKEDGYSLKEGYNFTDLNLKTNYKLSDTDRLFFSGFLSRDKYFYKVKEDQEFEGVGTQGQTERTQGWGNVIAALRWNHIFKKKIFVNTTAYFSSYNYYTTDLTKRTSTNPKEVEEKENSVEYISNISDMTIKQDYQFFPSNSHNIRFGAGAIFHKFAPGINSFYSKTDREIISNETGNSRINATELSLYFEDDWSVSDIFQVNGGIHISSFLVQGKTYFSAQPRVSARVSLTDKISLKAGFASMTQYMHLLTQSGITQSSDLWVPVTKNVKPQQSQQFSLGVSTVLSKMYLFEAEGYYKLMNSVIGYKDGATFLLDATGWEDKITSGEGEAYGTELFLKKTRGKLTGLIGYTLSWSMRQFNDINYGGQFPFRYDRRHDVSLVAKYRFNKKWSLNGAWVFYTGNAVTLPTSSYITPLYKNPDIQNNKEFPNPTVAYSYPSGNGVVANATERNNYRLPNYHRLDLTATYHKTKKWGEWELVFGATNIYNKMNPSFYYITDEYGNNSDETVTKYYHRTLFPFMPTISYSIKF